MPRQPHERPTALKHLLPESIKTKYINEHYGSIRSWWVLLGKRRLAETGAGMYVPEICVHACTARRLGPTGFGVLVDLGAHQYASTRFGPQLRPHIVTTTPIRKPARFTLVADV